MNRWRWAILVILVVCLGVAAGCDKTQTTTEGTEEKNIPAEAPADGADSAVPQAEPLEPVLEPAETLAMFYEALDLGNRELLYTVVPAEYQGREPIRFFLPTSGHQPDEYTHYWEGDYFVQSFIVYDIETKFIYEMVMEDSVVRVEWQMDPEAYGLGSYDGVLELEGDRWVVVAAGDKDVGEYFK